ncbi:hypothetical protein CYLTODRAFT_183344 [Cylindrobasidium torrendii FP15055 ss-10]|uniref:F-box domain-containing protein n=1 Tax=Cylindrobasidium torrendii FP15055 ss-10 TaxID=1314674 RepID=A0A0D7AY91_9AGAR|nr:hypothetical protein CYLTODRAFT_183344 [Cylindrobasidium torrendii FP15055 ss-10]
MATALDANAPARNRSKATQKQKFAPAKKAASRPSRKGPDRLKGVPDSVLLEMLSECEPLDLLSISRVNKRLCAILLSRSRIAKRIWSTSRARFDSMPAPLEGMSEAAWVQFLYVNRCSFCLDEPVSKIEIQLRKRLCSACIARLCSNGHEAADKIQADCDMMTEEFPRYDMLLPLFEAKGLGKMFPAVHVLNSDMESLKSKLMSVERKDRYNVLQLHLQAFERDRQHADTVKYWLSDNDNVILTPRRDIVLDRLRELGYGEEIDNLDNLGLRQKWLTSSHCKGKTSDPERSWGKMKRGALVLAKEARQKLILRKGLIKQSGPGEVRESDKAVHGRQLEDLQNRL